MNKLFQVLRTYIHRPRFWVLGACYGLVAWTWTVEGIQGRRVFVSAMLACVFACFVALHLRRQFGNAPAKMLPGFAVPHLAVGVAASLLIWAGMPLVQAWITRSSPWVAIAVHSIAGLLLALAICWPKALALLAVLPVAVVLAVAYEPRHGSFAHSFFAGNEPLAYTLMIGLAVLAHPIAALFLLRLSDQNETVSDDFSGEAPQSHRAPGFFARLMYAGRDAAVERRLLNVGRDWWSVQRWRVPVATSRAQLALAALAVVLLMAVVYFVSEQTPAAAWLAVTLSTGLMLIAPYGPWHWRRNCLAGELMLPVARAQYFRELAAAMALDVCLWAGLASAMIIVAHQVWLNFEPKPLPGHVSMPWWRLMWAQLITLWGAATFLYGVGLATLRFRYWAPLMALLGIAWTIAILWATMLAVNGNGLGAAGAAAVSFFAISVGLLLAGISTIRFICTDVD